MITKNLHSDIVARYEEKITRTNGFTSFLFEYEPMVKLCCFHSAGRVRGAAPVSVR